MSNRPACCSFCGATKEDVDHLIVSPDESAVICENCVGNCVEIIEEAEDPYVGLLH